MVTATPDTLGTVVAEIVQAAADAAAGVPQKLQDVFDQAGHAAGDALDEAEALPDAALAKLRQLADPPAWDTLLILLLLKVRDLDPAHLSVGAMKPDGWSRAVTLTYTLEPGKSVTLGFAMTDPGTTHGILLSTSAGLDTGQVAHDPLTFSVSSDGQAHWRKPFSGGLEPPAEQARVDATLSWDPKLQAGGDSAHVSIGSLRLRAVLSTKPGDPLYSLTLGFGEAGRPGVSAVVDLSSMLGALGQVVHIAAIDESYSPALTLTAGAAPQFTLGQGSPG